MADRPLHILMVHHTTFPHSIHGGVDAMLTALIPELQQEHRVSIFIPGQWAQRQWQSSVQAGVAIHTQRVRLPYIPDRPLRGLLGWLWETPRLLWRLWRLARSQQVDVIHLHTLQAYQYLFRLLRLLGGPPCVVTVHGTDIRRVAQKTGQNAALIRWSLRGAATVVGVSRELCELAEAYLPNRVPVCFVANGIAVNVEPVVVESMPALPERFFIQISDLEPVKGVDVAVRAWAEVRKQHPELHLVIIGTTQQIPSYTQEINDLVAALGLANHLHFVGKQNHQGLFAIARKSMGVLIPSRSEGLPYSLLETGLLALPVVCSNLRGCMEVVVHGQEGLVFTSEDPVALANAVLHLINHPQEARTMGAALHKKIVSHYSAAVMMNNYLAVYKKVRDRERE